MPQWRERAAGILFTKTEQLWASYISQLEQFWLWLYFNFKDKKRNLSWCDAERGNWSILKVMSETVFRLFKTVLLVFYSINIHTNGLFLITFNLDLLCFHSHMFLQLNSHNLWWICPVNIFFKENKRRDWSEFKKMYSLLFPWQLCKTFARMKKHSPSLYTLT